MLLHNLISLVPSSTTGDDALVASSKRDKIFFLCLLFITVVGEQKLHCFPERRQFPKVNQKHRRGIGKCNEKEQTRDSVEGAQFNGESCVIETKNVVN